MFIPTVLGPIDAGRVGVADAHGHAWIASDVPTAPVLDDEEAARVELTDFAEAGGTLLVDCQPGGCGRDGRVLARLSQGSGVALVAATGFHLARYYPHGVGPWALDDERALDLFTRELSQGLDEARDVRAGVVKTAWTGGGDQEEGLMRAALTAARRVGAGVVVHTEAGQEVEALARLIEDCGVAPGRVQISHVDKRPDLDLHRELARAGYVLGYDTFLRPTYEPERHVWPLLRAMIAEGLWRHVTLGLDLANGTAWRAHGGPGRRWLPSVALPRLRRDGVDDIAIQALS